MKRDRVRVWFSRLVPALILMLGNSISGYAMEAPGDGEPGWYYRQENHHWYYYNEEEKIHTGWLNYHGEWYWFNDDGWMADGGIRSIGGIPYYFFINGNMAWNQYVGMKFYNEEGMHAPEHDVRVIGKKSPSGEDRDLFSDYMYEIPRSWIARFIRDGWQMMFYKQKKYFAAPDTSQGIYYVYHNVDTHYKKIKFTDVDSVLQAFGEYVGYASGCFKKEDARMEALWAQEPAIASFLGIPDYYQNDAKFYFGKVFAAYLDEQDREVLLRLSPETCRIMEEILLLEEDEETRERLREKAQREQELADWQREQTAAEEGFGPGIKREERSSEIPKGQ